MTQDGQETAEAHRVRVLFVDADTRVLNSLRALFRQHYDVLVASQVHEALQALDDNDVDVIVADDQLPDTNGLALLQWVQARAPTAARILLVTAGEQPYEPAMIRRAQLFRVLPKPCDADLLRATIAQAGRSARIERAARPAGAAHPGTPEPARPALTAANDGGGTAAAADAPPRVPEDSGTHCTLDGNDRTITGDDALEVGRPSSTRIWSAPGITVEEDAFDDPLDPARAFASVVQAQARARAAAEAEASTGAATPQAPTKAPAHSPPGLPASPAPGRPSSTPAPASHPLASTAAGSARAAAAVAPSMAAASPGTAAGFPGAASAPPLATTTSAAVASEPRPAAPKSRPDAAGGTLPTGTAGAGRPLDARPAPLRPVARRLSLTRSDATDAGAADTATGRPAEVLIVSEDAIARAEIGRSLRGSHAVLEASSADQSLDQVCRSACSVVLIDGRRHSPVAVERKSRLLLTAAPELSILVFAEVAESACFMALSERLPGIVSVLFAIPTRDQLLGAIAWAEASARDGGGDRRASPRPADPCPDGEFAPTSPTGRSRGLLRVSRLWSRPGSEH